MNDQNHIKKPLKIFGKCVNPISVVFDQIVCLQAQNVNKQTKSHKLCFPGGKNRHANYKINLKFKKIHI